MFDIDKLYRRISSDSTPLESIDDLADFIGRNNGVLDSMSSSEKLELLEMLYTNYGTAYENTLSDTRQILITFTHLHTEVISMIHLLLFYLEISSCVYYSKDPKKPSIVFICESEAVSDFLAVMDIWITSNELFLNSSIFKKSKDKIIVLSF